VLKHFPLTKMITGNPRPQLV